jgi:hypothetical protein
MGRSFANRLSKRQRIQTIDRRSNDRYTVFDRPQLGSMTSSSWPLSLLSGSGFAATQQNGGIVTVLLPVLVAPDRGGVKTPDRDF